MPLSILMLKEAARDAGQDNAREVWQHIYDAAQDDSRVKHYYIFTQPADIMFGFACNNGRDWLVETITLVLLPRLKRSRRRS